VDILVGSFYVADLCLSTKTKIVSHKTVSEIKDAPVVQTPFVTEASCKKDRGAFIFRGHDGVVGRSFQSCTDAVIEWMYTPPPAHR
jgi:hypothetical protein